MHSPRSRNNLMTLAGESFGRQTFQNEMAVRENMADQNNSFDRDFDDKEETQQVSILREKLQDQMKENNDLRSLLDQTQSELNLLQQQAQEAPNQIQVIREMLREREPNLQRLLDESLRQERQNQENKEQKVLQILLQKDRLIDQLKQQIIDSESNLKNAFDQNKEVYANRENLQQQLEGKQRLIQSLELQLAEAKDMLQEFSSTDLMKTQAQIQSQSAYVRDLEHQLKSQQDNSKNESFFSEALERSRHEIGLKETQLKQLVRDLDQQRNLNKKIEQQLEFTSQQLDQYRESDITKKKVEVANLQGEKRLQQENEQLKTQVNSVLKKQANALKTLTQISGEPLENIEDAAIQIVEKFEQIHNDYQALDIEMRQAVEQNGLINQNTENERKQRLTSNQMVSVQSESEKSQDQQIKIVDKLREMIGEQEMEIQKLVAIVKATGNEHLVQNQKSTLGGHSDGTNNIIFVSDTLQVGSSNASFNKLNTKIQEMKHRENKLVEQISDMRQQIKYQSSHSEPNLATQQDSTDRSSIDNTSLRIAELESVILKQRDQLITLEEQLIEARRKLQDHNQVSVHKIELLSLRNKNLQELNRKIETIQNGVASSSDLFGTLKTSPHTGIDTERMRQALQTTDLNNMELKHKTQELTLQRDKLKQELETLQQQNGKLENQLVRAQQDLVVMSVGLNTQDSQLAVLIQDQKERISQLEYALRQPSKQTANNMTVVRVHEEFLTKVEQITEKCISEKQALTTQIVQANQKVQNLKQQLHLIEKRESKTNCQLEQGAIQSGERTEAAEQRQKETERLLQAKNDLICQLERDIQAQECVLQERQEQLSVLLSAIDNGGGSQNDQKQKLANLAAELCQMMSQKSALEKQAAESTSLSKQAVLTNQSLTNDLHKLKEKYQSIQAKETTLVKTIESYERKFVDLEIQMSQHVQDFGDSKYNCERLSYHLKSKDEAMLSMKDLYKKSESVYREQVQQIKQKLVDRGQTQQSTGRKQDNELKVAIQKLNLALLENEFPNYDNVVKEFQQTLQTAYKSVEKLQFELDQKQAECDQLDLQWDALALNKVITQRYEQSLATTRQTHSLLGQREIELAAFHKCTIDQQINNVVSDLENQLESYQCQTLQLAQELNQLQQTKSQFEGENAVLRQKVSQFEIELKANRAQMEKKAEITVDERQRTTEQSLKTYFDSHLTKLIVGGNGSQDRTLDLGREICSLKLLVNQLQTQVSFGKSKIDSLDTVLKVSKQGFQDSQTAISQLESKNSELQRRSKAQLAQSVLTHEKLKKQSLQTEKELIRANELVQQKNREISQLKINQVQSNTSMDSANATMALSSPTSQYDTGLSKRVQELQEEVIELRQGRMFEMDELRLQYELELAETKRNMSLQQQEIKQRYTPGYSPQELSNHNSELIEQMEQLKQDFDQVNQENHQMRKQCEETELYAQNMSLELEDVKNAMQELHIVLHNQTDAGFLRNSVNSQNPLAFTDQKRSKSALRNSKAQSKVCELSAQKQNEIKFTQNPPALVRALVQAKINEQHSKSKLRRQLQVEASLRQMISKKLPVSELVSELITQNEAILQILNSEQQSQSVEQGFGAERQADCHEEDYECLVMGVLSLAIQLAQSESAQIELTQLHEKLPLSKIVQAQRIVIKSLAAKNSDKTIRYIPERDQDRKIWFLQLLESQIGDAEIQTDRLVDFIKRLQVAVSGNLQSAAEIRATSIDLAQNTKEASEEIKTLRHVAALMKHDVQAMTNNIQNPFSEDLKHTYREDQLMTGRSTNQGVEKLMTERDSAQSQLSLTSKIKQSLEQELVNLKLQHANELQGQIHNMRNLHNQVLNKEKQLEKAQALLNETQMQVKLSEKQLEEDHIRIRELETLVEKAAIRVEKTAGSSTSLRKLQQDMQDWRKQSDANLRQKQDALDTIQAELVKSKTEAQRLKSENQMLRRVQSDIRSGEEQMNLLREIEQLRQQVNMQQEDRDQERNVANKEKTLLMEKVGQLESAFAQGDNTANKESHQLLKQLNQLKHDLKSKQAELIAAKDILTQTQILKVAVESKLQTSQASVLSNEEKVGEYKKSLKQASFEIEVLKQARQSVVETKDKDASQIAQEMIGLRETFMKLKVERDQLALQLQKNQQVFDKKDKEWRAKVSELQAQLQRIEGTYVNQATESHDSVLVLSERNKVLINDLKYFKDQYEKVQANVTELIQKASVSEAIVNAQQQEQAALQQRMDVMRKEVAEMKSQNQEKDHQLRESELQGAEQEAAHNEKLRTMQQTYTRLRVETQAAMQALSQQIMILKQKGDKQKPVKEIDQALQITQKEVALKQLRKELAVEKQKVLKLKQQKTELKEQLQPDPKQKQKGGAPALPKWKEEMLEMLKDSPSLKKLLKSTRDQNTTDSKVIELQAECLASETEAFRLKQQVEELQFKIEELQQLILDAKSNAKDGKSSLIEKHNQVVSGLKEQVRALYQELCVVKEEFVSPSEQQPLIDQIKDLQHALKTAQADLVRKNKLITTLRQQKDSSAAEVDLVLQDLKGLRDDNQRLQKALREGKSSASDLKEMRETYEWLQRQEKQMKEEIVSLHERNKNLKSEVNRKDTQIRDYRDQCNQKNKEVEFSKEVTQQIDKLKDDKKRLKLELDIKENQNRSLKQHIEQSRQPVQDNKSSMSTFEHDLKQSKQKAKKYESHLKRSIQVLAQVGAGLVQMAPEDRVLSSNTKTEISNMNSEADYLRDAGQILGVSIHELEDFMNATPNRNKHSTRSQNSQQSILGKLKRLQGMPDTLDDDLEEIGEYCVKLIGDMQCMSQQK